MIAAVREFLAMGGYGAYVWPAYGLTAIVMAALLIASLRGLRERQRQLRALEGTAGDRRRRNRPDASPEPEPDEETETRS